MRVAALYDIHGNLPALEAVLRDVRDAGVDLVVSGGDVVPGPMPREVIETLLNIDLPIRFIQGNGDREVLGVRQGSPAGRFPENLRPVMQWTADQLDDDIARVMAAWPPTLRLPIEPLGDVLFCHATPRNDTEIFTRATSEERLAPIFDAVGASIVVCGHTHMQFDRHVGSTRVLNAGSVGMPFAKAGAYWVLLGPEVRLLRTSYDLALAAVQIRATAYPDAEQFAQRNVLHPPTEEETLAGFSRLELQ